jgi:hypothetical protein
MRVRVIGLVVGLVCVCAGSAAAQTTGTTSVGGRVFGWADWQQMAAKESFDAVAGTTTATGVGGGAEIHRLWKGVFLRGAVSRMKVEGERVFVFDGAVFPLNQPLEITMTPIELGAGWRFGAVGERLVPYVGAGAVWLKYREDGQGSTSADRVNETYTGAVIFGGVDVSVWRFVSAGAEVAWRTAKVKDAGGVFEAFGEDDLGGISVRVMLSVGR